mgnify:CR=1 FL=1
MARTTRSSSRRGRSLTQARSRSRSLSVEKDIEQSPTLVVRIRNNYIIPALKAAWRVAGIYVIWMFIHYIASHLYTYFCVPYTFLGFIAAPFLVTSPHCAGLRWCIVHGAETITAMWVVIGTWLVTLVVRPN